MHLDQFNADGFVTITSVLSDDDCQELLEAVATLGSEMPGTRCLLRYEWCKVLVAQLRQNADIAAVMPPDYVAAQCTYFEKSLSRNWLVPVHQDLSIPVAERVSHPRLLGWSKKEEMLFVQPPAELLERLVAVRVHLDPCSTDDGPLQFVPGSHTLGRIDAETASRLRRHGPVESPVLQRGDALVMRPLTLHASSKASGMSRRRVLHFLFGPQELPFGLRWPQTT